MGRHFLQIPGPTNVPDEVLHAIAMPTIDHRGPEFQALGTRLLEQDRPVFGTTDPVVVYPASGTGAWEAALVNTLSPGDRVLFFETGHFAMLWEHMAARARARRRGGPRRLAARRRPGRRAGAARRRHGARDPGRLRRPQRDLDRRHQPRRRGARRRWTRPTTPRCCSSTRSPRSARSTTATTSGGSTSRSPGSQKGLMLPPGLSFNAVSAKAREASATAQLRRSFWDWRPILAANAQRLLALHPGTNLLYGLDVALDMLYAEGLENVFARHQRHAAATRAAVREWGLEVLCLDEREYSGSLTAILVPEGHDADALRRIILERFDMSLGAGLTKLAGKVFRIGHLGDFNDLTLAGTLAGVQMGLHLAGVPVKGSGVDAALELLREPQPRPEGGPRHDRGRRERPRRRRHRRPRPGGAAARRAARARCSSTTTAGTCSRATPACTRSCLRAWSSRVDADDVAATVRDRRGVRRHGHAARRRHRPWPGRRSAAASCSTSRATWTGSSTSTRRPAPPGCSPGVVQDDLNRAAAPFGLMFGPDTSTSNRATIGGMVGNNSAGSGSLRFGMTIDHVRALEVVLSDGSRAVLSPVDEAERARRAAADTLEGPALPRAACARRAGRDGAIETGVPAVLAARRRLPARPARRRHAVRPGHLPRRLRGHARPRHRGGGRAGPQADATRRTPSGTSRRPSRPSRRPPTRCRASRRRSS